MNGWKLILGALTRNALQYAFAALVAHRMLTKGQADILPIGDMATGIVGGILTAGWSLWQKAESRWKFLAALRAVPSTPPEKIAAAAKITPVSERIAAIVS